MMPSVAFRGSCPHNTQVNELLRRKISVLYMKKLNTWVTCTLNKMIAISFLAFRKSYSEAK